MARTLVVPIILFALTACTSEERPSYAALVNNLQPGGPMLQFEDSEGFVNVEELSANLTEQQREVFELSLNWYGTES